MKRLFLILPFLMLALTINAQDNGLANSEQTGIRYFGQCMLNLAGEEQYIQLENSLKSNANIAIVRLDRISQRAFIVTKQLESLNEEQFRSWFGEEGVNISCVQVGIKGVDKINKYPFTNCQN